VQSVLKEEQQGFSKTEGEANSKSQSIKESAKKGKKAVKEKRIGI